MNLIDKSELIQLLTSIVCPERVFVCKIFIYSYDEIHNNYNSDLNQNCNWNGSPTKILTTQDEAR